MPLMANEIQVIPRYPINCQLLVVYTLSKLDLHADNYRATDGLHGRGGQFTLRVAPVRIKMRFRVTGIRGVSRIFLNKSQYCVLSGLQS